MNKVTDSEIVVSPSDSDVVVAGQTSVVPPLAPDADAECFISLRSGAVLPDDFDLAGAHLIEVDSDMDFTVTCGPLTSGKEDPEVRSSFIDRGCLVKQVCDREYHPGAKELDPYGGFVDHGVYHMPEGEEGGVGFSIPLANICGLFGFLAEGHDDWLRELLERSGSGRYLVNAATAEDGCVIGVNTIKVVD